MPGGGPLHQVGTSDSNGRELANLKGAIHVMNYYTQAALVSERQKTLLAEGARRSQQAQCRRPLAGMPAARRSALGRLADWLSPGGAGGRAASRTAAALKAE
jgi:hypothetical protein